MIKEHIQRVGLNIYAHHKGGASANYLLINGLH